MRNFKTLLLLLAFVPFLAYSQEKEEKKSEMVPEVDIFFNEFSASVNMTMVQNENTSPGVGGGVGIYRVWRNDKMVNIINGVEYNYSAFTKDKVYEGSTYAYYDNVHYRMHNISIPVLVRFTFGERTKLFAETGGFMDFTVGANRKGVYKTTTDEGTPLDIAVHENANLRYFNYGFSAGIGARIPVKGIDLLIKVDYKFGIRDLYKFDEKFHNRYLRLSFGVNLK
ncbi:MAG: PorT family protein [Crocinitomicaceae bacterium]|nr:PorT family protein [Crocinitomicaceae bacterium]